MRADLRENTSFYAVLEQLGLDDANWLDFLLDHPRGVSLWLTQRSSSARRWNPPNDFLSLPGDHEHPAADPRQVFFHSAISHYPFAPANHTWQAPRHKDPILLKDRHGCTYLMSIADGADGTFMLEAASRCPKVLFGDSPSLHPRYDAFKHIQSQPRLHQAGPTLRGLPRFRAACLHHQGGISWPLGSMVTCKYFKYLKSEYSREHTPW